MFSFDFIIEGSREIPDQIKDFNGVFKGACRIVKCDSKSTLVGQIKALYIFNMVSISTAFVYRVQKAQFKGQLIEVDAKEQVLTIGLKKDFNQVDLNHIYDEVGILDEGRKRFRPQKKQKKNDDDEEEEEDVYAWMNELSQVDKFVPETLEKYKVLVELMHKKSDAFRLQYIQLLCVFFIKKKGTLSEEQREKIRGCDTQQLVSFCAILKERPWELAFRETASPLDPLVMSQYELACRKFNINVPRHIVLSMRLYYACLERMREENHTCFQWTTEARKTLNLLEFEKIAPLVMTFLEKHAITWIDVEKTSFALKQEYSEAKMICQALMRVAKSAWAPLELRDENVPIIPPKLTTDQERIARHVCENYLTVVEGLPGTGKTVLIEWLFSRLKNVLLCTLTGMMTKTLRMRMGNRHETAHTIDHLISVALHTKKGRSWLKKFEVLVIDEFSNTSTKGLAWLLSFLPNLKRIVFVGDHEQIGSISPGDAMGDIKKAYAPFGHTFRLTEILRVEKHLEDLYTAPLLMSQRKHRNLVFKDSGPLTLITPSTQQGVKVILSKILDQVFAHKRCLMAHQIVVLQNDIRHRINEECQAICKERGLISGAKKGYQIGKRTYYEGSKITFLENYNKPTKHILSKKKNLHIISDIISNGETGVIKSIVVYGTNMYYITFVDDDRHDSPKENVVTKHVICSASVGVKPFHIDLGYATTTTKVQGREFEYAIFWNNARPAPCWTRAHAYVALSRGKKRVWCVSTAGDLYAICDRPNPERKTVLSHLLTKCSYELTNSSSIDIFSFPYESTVQKPFVLIPKSTPCVPTVLEEEEEEEEEEDLDN
jgi:hypothetical protein